MLPLSQATTPIDNIHLVIDRIVGLPLSLKQPYDFLLGGQLKRFLFTSSSPTVFCTKVKHQWATGHVSLSMYNMVICVDLEHPETNLDDAIRDELEQYCDGHAPINTDDVLSYLKEPDVNSVLVVNTYGDTALASLKQSRLEKRVSALIIVLPDQDRAQAEALYSSKQPFAGFYSVEFETDQSATDDACSEAVEMLQQTNIEASEDASESKTLEDKEQSLEQPSPADDDGVYDRNSSRFTDRLAAQASKQCEPDATTSSTCTTTVSAPVDVPRPATEVSEELLESVCDSLSLISGW